jgi:hypothetical protein
MENDRIIGVDRKGNPVYGIETDKIKSPMDSMDNKQLLDYRKSEFDRLKKELEGRNFAVRDDVCNMKGYKVFKIINHTLFIDGKARNFNDIVDDEENIITVLALLEGEYIKQKYKGQYGY